MPDPKPCIGDLWDRNIGRKCIPYQPSHTWCFYCLGSMVPDKPWSDIEVYPIWKRDWRGEAPPSKVEGSHPRTK
ncbi:uncharacterized protein CcaverHIS019_0309870 [Cutaneotrichosporon cavernicola]|uniref:Uncharacterized protein n=1 Tax=Cutaneotrichosporon cavernicola TaxID=279322 RepID=A0AA48IDF6_9TREE|nr:uncharacterized protein CcaverHIS019_0309870 [Cutaneotrichosporon cavernicola]BEI90917.1 hypothetical protein CcaverHIS019_0309870 [Cutaneotrichosporon cavernicola]